MTKQAPLNAKRFKIHPHRRCRGLFLCERIAREQVQSLLSFSLGVVIFALESPIIVTNTLPFDSNSAFKVDSEAGTVLPHRLMSLVPIRHASLSDSKAAEKLWPSLALFCIRDMFLKACFVRSDKTRRKKFKNTTRPCRLFMPLLGN